MDFTFRTSLRAYLHASINLDPNEVKAVNSYLANCETEGILRGISFVECNIIIIDEVFYNHWKNYKSTEMIIKKVNPVVIVCARKGETLFNSFLGYISSDFLP